jgi:carboxypeptidase Taq
MFAAQFFEAANRDLGDLSAQFANGDFAPLKAWLGAKIHRLGRQYRAQELVQRVAGAPLSHEPLVRHLRAKFGPLYGI